APSPAEEIHPDIVLFFQAASSDEKIAEAALDEIEKHWRDGYTPMFIDFARLMRAPVRARSGAAGGGGSLVPETMADAREGHIPTDLSARSAAAAGERGSPVRRRLLQFLKKRTGQKFGEDLDGWRRWMWSLPYDPHPDYAFFKAGV
ncbi:MAG: hypothetical protein GTO30_09825, partial [Acidobacteria bacterium]|nr:hypothetical protein [Acidobacteriota bacterium]